MVYVDSYCELGDGKHSLGTDGLLKFWCVTCGIELSGAYLQKEEDTIKEERVVESYETNKSG